MVIKVVGKVPNPFFGGLEGSMGLETIWVLVPGKMFINHLLLITEVEKVAGLVDINRICQWTERMRMISAKYT